MNILHMYKSKHSRTWDESVPYVKNNHNRSLHRSSRQIPFEVGMGSQPLCTLDVAMPFVTTQEEYSHVLFEVDKSTRFIDCIQHIL